jgi:hypothetical protein
MNNKKEILNELQSISKLLFDVKNKEGNNEVLENYFENFEENLLQKINRSTVKEEKQTIVKSISSYFKPIAIAACIVGLCLFFGLKMMDNKNTIEPAIAVNTETKVTQTEIQNYMTENLTDFESKDIYTVFKEQNIDTATLTEDNIVLDNDVIENYLAENPTSIDDLIYHDSENLF